MCKDLTPVERVDKYWVKRDDLFEIFGVSGGKARACYQLILDGISKGYKTFVTAGSRHSPQCELVSTICENLNVGCVLFMPKGDNTSVICNINKNKLSKIIRCNAGYNNVIIASALTYVREHKECYYIPFGMEFKENINTTKSQVCNIPKDVKRIVVPVGSGMSFCSIATGLIENNMTDIELVGVRVGKDPMPIIKKYLGIINNRLFKQRFPLKWKIVNSQYSYDKELDITLGNISLDPIYEAKCADFLEEDDLLWIVGRRK